MRMKYLSTLMLALVFPVPAFAAAPTCQNTGTDTALPFVQQIAEKLHYKALAFASCKPSPNHIGMTYVALFNHTEKNHSKKNCMTNCSYDIAFVLADSLTGEIKKRLIQKQTINDEKSEITKVEVDTNIYQLNPAQRATGVRLYFERTIKRGDEKRTDLYLLIERNNEFRPALGNVSSPDDTELTKLVVNKTLIKKGPAGTCFRYKLEIDRQIELGGYHNGFRDLAIKSQVNDSTGNINNGTCVETSIAKSTGQTVVPFNGTVYFLPQWLSH